MPSTDIMLDLETLDTSSSATILTISAQGFDPFSNRLTDDTYHEKITLESQDNRTINDGTVEWWAKQDQEVYEDIFSMEGRIDLKPALEKLTKMIWSAKRFWSHGVHPAIGENFDFAILTHAYQQCGLNPPWQFYQIMDSRTIIKLMPTPIRFKNSHNSLEDCINQIDAIQSCFKALGITSLN